MSKVEIRFFFTFVQNNFRYFFIIFFVLADSLGAHFKKKATRAWAFVLKLDPLNLRAACIEKNQFHCGKLKCSWSSSKNIPVLAAENKKLTSKKISQKNNESQFCQFLTKVKILKLSTSNQNIDALMRLSSRNIMYCRLVMLA